jgi:two-component system, NarL family, response regulator
MMAASGSEALDLWRQLEPDVTLLELRLPGQDGIATTEAIRAIAQVGRLALRSTSVLRRN